MAVRHRCHMRANHTQVAQALVAGNHSRRAPGRNMDRLQGRTVACHQARAQLALALLASIHSPVQPCRIPLLERLSAQSPEAWIRRMVWLHCSHQRWRVVPIEPPHSAAKVAALQWRPRKCGSAHVRPLQDCRSAGNTADCSNSFASPCHSPRAARETYRRLPRAAHSWQPMRPCVSWARIIAESIAEVVSMGI